MPGLPPPPFHVALVKMAIEAVQKKGIGTGSCNACGKSDVEGDVGAFSLSPINYNATPVAHMVPFTHQMFPLVPGSNVTPMLALICTNCGSTKFFNLKALGLIR